MHSYILALILGVVEGLTEFLPVSSTAHLRICEALLGIDLGNGYWKMFSIIIQLGAILCLPIYFRSRIAEFFSTFPEGKRGDKNFVTHPVSLVMIAFVCTAGPAFLLTKVIGKHLESLYIMGASLVIGGTVMWFVDWLYDRGVIARECNRTDDMEDMSLGQAIWVGLWQITSAVFPGTSRSMSTIASGQVAGMSRKAALEFSFFLSIPTMVVATCYEAFKTMLPHHGVPPIGTGPANAEQWIALAIGFVVSFIVAYIVVAWFMQWVRKHGFVPFAIWRLAIGAYVLLAMVKLR